MNSRYKYLTRKLYIKLILIVVSWEGGGDLEWDEAMSFKFTLNIIILMTMCEANIVKC